MQEPRVILVRSTQDPLSVIYWSWLVMKQEIPDEPLGCGKSIEFLEDFYKEFIKEGLATSLEYVDTVWKLENVSRALLAQITRHRLFSFSVQSMRVVDKLGFAEKGLYHIPDRIINNPTQLVVFEAAMLMIQKTYKKMLRSGVAIEDARGILPLNTYTTITFSGNLRTLLDMMSKRFCNKVQGEFKKVAMMMREEIRQKMPSVIADSIKSPCEMHGKCLMKMENESQIAGKDTRPPCPKYIKLFCKDNK